MLTGTPKAAVIASKTQIFVVAIKKKFNHWESWHCRAEEVLGRSAEDCYKAILRPRFLCQNLQAELPISVIGILVR